MLMYMEFPHFGNIFKLREMTSKKRIELIEQSQQSVKIVGFVSDKKKIAYEFDLTK